MPRRGAVVVGGIIFVVAVLASVRSGCFRSSAEVTETLVEQPNSTILPVAVLATLAPTATPLPPRVTVHVPTITSSPTQVPANPTQVVSPTSTPLPPVIIAGEGGVNVRAGAGIDYMLLGFLEPRTETRVTGQHAGWWQIDYNGSPGWVFGEIVTARNTDGVPDPTLPATPTPSLPAATPTPISPTPTAGPPTFNGLVADNFWIEGAPGPYNPGSDIWFKVDIMSVADGDVAYESLGTRVEETGQFQMTPFQQVFAPGQRLLWRGHINISAAGTYHLWLHICFSDTDCVNMRGPVVVNVR